MTTQALERLLCPASVAVVGASREQGSVGHIVLDNILDGGFAGKVYAVNPHPMQRVGAIHVAAIRDLPTAPDLAVIACPASAVPQAVRDLGTIGTPIAAVLSRGFEHPNERASLLALAREHQLRIIGPNSLGVLLPRASLNASFASGRPAAGSMALISQSGAIVTAMLDWAAARHFGFSVVVSAGDMADVGLADLIDLCAADHETDAILLYIEGIDDAPAFMSAARAASRLKPVVALKGGRTESARSAIATHTGALAGAYDVHLAAFRRAGIMTVDTMEGLFDAAQMLSRYPPRCGNRVAIVTNGGGAAVLAADALAEVGGELATLSAATGAALDRALLGNWSRRNPIDIGGDAHADRFEAAIAAAGKDPACDVVLAMHCPTAVDPGEVVAAATVRGAKAGEKPVIGCWLGPNNAAAARPAFDGANLCVFDSVGDAVRGFGQLWQASEIRRQLTSPAGPHDPPQGARDNARLIVEQARRDGRRYLSGEMARRLLAAYGIPVLPTALSKTAGGVAAACAGLPAPYVVKLSSPDLPHKSDVGGVVGNLADASAAARAAEDMAQRIAAAHPSAVIEGYEIQSMVDTRTGVEMFVGVADDPVFGPVVAVGSGGKAVEVLRDRALDLPPIDHDRALAMLGRTRAAKLLAGYRDVPAGDIAGLGRVIESVSALIGDVPDIAELDINPLLVTAAGVTALDVRIVLGDPHRRTAAAIAPAPVAWETDLVTRSGLTLHVRAARPGDEERLAEFYRHVTPDDLRFRFLSALRVVAPERLVAMTDLDYARAVNFLAFTGDRLVATAMLVSGGDPSSAELAVSVDREFKHRGVSWTLVDHVVRYAKAKGIRAIESVENTANTAAIDLEREFGFVTVASSGPERTLRLTIDPSP